MVGVIVHDSDALRLPHQVEATADTREIGEHAGRLLHVEPERPDEREHRRGIEHVVHTGILFDLAFDLRAVGKLEREGRTHDMRAIRHDARVAFLPQTVRDRAGVHRARRADERLLLAAHDDGTVLGDGGHELLELLEDLAEVLVVVKMVGLNIGDDDARGREERERLV